MDEMCNVRQRLKRNLGAVKGTAAGSPTRL
jgi:hypothetical protein